MRALDDAGIRPRAYLARSARSSEVNSRPLCVNTAGE